MNLLRNPNLMRQSNVVNAAVATPMTHTHEDQLMDENTDEIIANKTKRSRDLITNKGHIETSPHSTKQSFLLSCQHLTTRIQSA